MSRYMPVYQYPDMMPVDISFVFEDGTPAKFWGVIFNGAWAAWILPEPRRCLALLACARKAVCLRRSG